MLDNQLIEKALSLTGKIMEDMYVMRKQVSEHIWTVGEFSIEKFCYYLLSESFIEKYKRKRHGMAGGCTNYYRDFGEAIHEYQKGNPEPLRELLSKI